LAVLDKWSKGYAETDFWEDRENAYFMSYEELKDNRKAFDRAKAARAKKPEFYYGLVHIMTNIGQLNPLTDADYATAVEAADYVLSNDAKVFAVANKPISLDDKTWPTVKTPVLTMAKQTKVYVLQQQKKNAELQALLIQYLKEDPTQANYNLLLA